ncbi:Cyclin-U4-3 [Diplonema papillatum]|nr:Cyclin-U4-3 [Diplonema papillatum]|eukprot:gene14585-22310_t
MTAPISRAALLQHLKSFMARRIAKSPVGVTAPEWLDSFVAEVEQMVSSRHADLDDAGMLPMSHAGLAFESMQIPPVALRDYCWLIWVGLGACNCGKGLWGSALVLLRRFLAVGHTPLTPNTLHRLLLVTLIVSCKVVDDCQPSNALAAALGGIDRQNLNHMERVFLLALDFNVHVTRFQYESAVSQLLCNANDDKTLEFAPLTPTSSYTPTTPSSTVTPCDSPRSASTLSVPGSCQSSVSPCIQLSATVSSATAAASKAKRGFLSTLLSKISKK